MFCVRSLGRFSSRHVMGSKQRSCLDRRSYHRLHVVPFFSLCNWETGASDMRDRARDWSERGRRPRGCASRLLSITVDEKRSLMISKLFLYSMADILNWLSLLSHPLNCWCVVHIAYPRYVFLGTLRVRLGKFTTCGANVRRTKWNMSNPELEPKQQQTLWYQAC